MILARSLLPVFVSGIAAATNELSTGIKDDTKDGTAIAGIVFIGVAETEFDRGMVKLLAGRTGVVELGAVKLGIVRLAVGLVPDTIGIV